MEISAGANTVLAGNPGRPSRSCTNCMSMQAAFSAAAVSFISRSAVAIWLSSRPRPWDLASRNSCSMVQRN
ncbi:MAG: hypothetical protein ACJ8AW_47685, partial [Rhodopila sp.]